MTLKNLLSNYDIIFTDLDHTLIYGWFPDFSAALYRMFPNKALARFLAKVQRKFSLYRINTKVVYALKQYIHKRPIWVITARDYSPDTIAVIYEVLGQVPVRCLGSNNAPVDKAKEIVSITMCNGLKTPPYTSILLEDNMDTIRYVNKNTSTLAIDVRPMYEDKFVG